LRSLCGMSRCFYTLRSLSGMSRCFCNAVAQMASMSASTAVMVPPGPLWIFNWPRLIGQWRL
jgi:hypothetical protein